MFRFAYNASALLAVTAIVLVTWPALLCLAVRRAWHAIELRAVYGGDEAAREKDRWRYL